MNTRINTVFVMVVTLVLVLSIGILTTIHSQQAFATRTGINGGICTTNNCNANGASGNGGSGASGNGGNGANSNGAQGGNGGNGE
jgi:hypothetical protein